MASYGAVQRDPEDPEHYRRRLSRLDRGDGPPKGGSVGVIVAESSAGKPPARWSITDVKKYAEPLGDDGAP